MAATRGQFGHLVFVASRAVQRTGAVPGFMAMLGDGTDIPMSVAVIRADCSAWPDLTGRVKQGTA
jgi:hypothetical protein